MKTTTTQPDELRGRIFAYERSSFVRAVYRVGGWVALGGAGFFAVFGVWRGLSFATGALVAVGSFRLLEETLRRLLESKRRRRRWIALFWTLCKYTGLGVVLYFLGKFERFRIGSFAVGLCTLYFAVVVVLAKGEIVRRGTPGSNPQQKRRSNNVP